MTEPELREALRRPTPPDEIGAEERAWRILRAAYDGQSRSRPRLRARPAAAIAAVVAAAVFALTPPGAAVGDWIADTLRTPAGAPSSKPVLTSLPAPGRLLVTSVRGPWVVKPDGTKRRLGDYGEAGWSPNGRFVVATRGRQLVALEPDGTGAERWTLARPERVAAPSWSLDDDGDTRIAYLSDDELRVVAGDGTGDTRLGAGPATVVPAWRPDNEHILAWATPEGSIRVVDTDTGRTLWRADVGAPPRSLHWTGDASRLVVVLDRRVELLSAGGRRLRTLSLPADTRAAAAAVHPSQRTLALTRYRAANDRSEAVAIDLATGRERRLFAGQGRFSGLAWSPDGDWLLLAWRDADQWLFLRSDEVRRIEALGNVSRQFDPGGVGPAPFPAVEGWCCPSASGP